LRFFPLESLKATYNGVLIWLIYNKSMPRKIRELQQIAIKRVYVQNAKTLSRLDLVTKPCGGFDQKSL